MAPFSAAKLVLLQKILHRSMRLIMKRPFVMPQTQKGPKHEKDISKVLVDIFFPLFDNSIQINYIKYQHQELS